VYWLPTVPLDGSSPPAEAAGDQHVLSELEVLLPHPSPCGLQSECPRIQRQAASERWIPTAVGCHCREAQGKVFPWPAPLASLVGRRELDPEHSIATLLSAPLTVVPPAGGEGVK